MVAWCHGAPGIAASRLLAQACGFAVAPDIDAALGATARLTEQWYRVPNADFTACHGLFGLVDVA